MDTYTHSFLHMHMHAGPLLLLYLCAAGLILFVARLFEHTDEGDDAAGGEDGPVCSFEYDEIFVSAASEVAGV